MIRPGAGPHPDASTVARFVDGTLDAAELAVTEAHLAACAECREEVFEVYGILRSRPRRRVAVVPIAGAAAAAIALFLIWPGADQPPAPPLTREPALTTTLAPRPIFPLDTVTGADSIRWSGVPGARRYSLALFAADGRLLWQVSARDTVAALPDSVRLDAGASYYWQIKAEARPGRWAESELVPFTLDDRSGAP